MKRLLVFMILSCASAAHGQRIVGTWQAGDTLLGSMYRERYVFKSTKEFVYYTSEYDGLQRILSIGGHYRMAGNVLYLTPEYTVENRAGTLERSHITTLNGSWAIEGGQFKTYRIAKQVQQSVQFKLVQRKKGRCLLLDLAPYYKITPAN